MQFLIGFLTSAFGSIAEWFIKKLSFSKLVYVFIAGLVLSLISLFFAFLYFALQFILDIWQLISNTINSLPSLSGDENIVSNFFAFMHASGLDTALSVSFNLLLTILSAWFIIKLYVLFSSVLKNVLNLVMESLKILK